MEDNIVHFIWRNIVASYDLSTKELKFNHWNMYIIPWENYPKDMVKFIEWIRICQEHKEEVLRPKLDSEGRCIFDFNGERIMVPSIPKTVEMY
jgi:hypothetical protein